MVDDAIGINQPPPLQSGDGGLGSSSHAVDYSSCEILDGCLSSLRQ